NAKTAPYNTPTIPNVMAMGANVWAASGNSGIVNRNNPYAPVFNKSPARMTLPPVGASVWASGSHVWSGTTGSFTAKPTKNANISHQAVDGAIESASKSW